MSVKINVSPKNRLLNATRILSSLGIDLQAKSVARDITAQRIKELEVLGREDAQAVMEVLTHLDSFDDVVREQIKEMRTAERYEIVRSNFKTILDDADRMVTQISTDGKMSLLDKVQNRVIEWRRGTIQSRFQELRNTCEQVFADVNDQIEREMKILEAYAEFRVALKESTLVAEQLKRRAEERKDGYAETLTAAQAKVDAAREGKEDVLIVGTLELARDQARREFEVEDRRYQGALDLSEQLLIAYATAEAVMTKLAQTTQIKDAQQRKCTTFYTANSGTLTALTVAFTSIKGLHEGTATQEALNEGMNDALRRLSNMGTQVQEQALRVTYGKTLDADAIRQLFNSAVEFEERQRVMITELRAASKENDEKVRQVIEEGQSKMAEALARRTATPSNGSVQSIELSVPEPAALAASSSAPEVRRKQAP